MVIYIAGPMTGYKDLNYPAFDEAAADLRALGYEVITPSENPDPDPKTWENFMKMSIPQVCKADQVVTLPGYMDSKGATIEVALAYDIGIPVCSLERFMEDDEV